MGAEGEDPDAETQSERESSREQEAGGPTAPCQWLHW